MKNISDFDSYINAMIIYYSSRNIVEAYEPLLREYAIAVKKLDPNGLGEEEEKEIFQSVCIEHQDDIVQISIRAKQAAYDYFNSLGEDQTDKLLERSCLDWARSDNKEPTASILKTLRDTLLEEYGKVLPVWLGR